jgi:sugar phosphate isomerase/epimerase
MKMKRRKFLGATGAMASTIFLSPRDLFATSPKTNSGMNNNFKLVVLATNWGFNGTLDEYCAKVKNDGYDGIEIWWPSSQKDQDEMFNVLKKHSLEVGFLTAGYESNYNEHFSTFKKMIDAAATNTIQKPLYINCHSGRDHFTYEQGKTFIDHTTALSKATGIRISHETHRSRLLYSAPVARYYIDTIPELRVTFDVSHWCNVHESLLQDQQVTVDRTLQRVDHIHARIGHPEGPQVNDPRAPEWKDAVKAHLTWWDKVAAIKKEKGEAMTVLTEFGPPDYMPTLPYTREPLADQWAINVYMLQLLRQRYPS